MSFNVEGFSAKRRDRQLQLLQMVRDRVQVEVAAIALATTRRWRS